MKMKQRWKQWIAIILVIALSVFQYIRTDFLNAGNRYLCTKLHQVYTGWHFPRIKMLQ